jgi:hypothetical protein
MTLLARSHFVLVALLALLTLPARAADEGVALKWKFKPKQTSRYSTSVDIKAQHKAGGGQPDEMTSKQTSDMTWLVDAVDDDGNAHITQVIERVRVESSAKGEKMVFDSDDEKLPEGVDEAAVEPLKVMVNQPVNLVIDPRGKVLDVRPSDKLAEKLKKSSQYGPLAAMFSRDNLKQMTSMNTLEFPAEPISRGTTWQQQAKVNDPMSGRQTLETTYRYDGSEEHDGQKLDKISATAKVSPAAEQGAAPRIAIKDQKSNGVIWFDRTIGRIHGLEMTTKVVREINLGASKVEETLTTKIHMRLAAETE